MMNLTLLKLLIKRIPYFKELHPTTKYIMIKDELEIFKKDIINKYGSNYEYLKDWAKRRGYKNLNEYRLELIKNLGYESIHQYEDALARKRGFKNSSELTKISQKKCAIEAGYNTRVNYENFLAKKRGFESYTHYNKYRCLKYYYSDEPENILIEISKMKIRIERKKVKSLTKLLEKIKNGNYSDINVNIKESFFKKKSRTIAKQYINL